MSLRQTLNYVSHAAGYSPHVKLSPIMARESESESETETDPRFLPEAVNLTNAHNYGLLGDLTTSSAEYTHGLSGINQEQNYLFAAVLGLTLAGLVAVTLLLRWMRMGHSHMRFLFTHGDKGSQRYWSRNSTSWWPSIKKHLLYAPLWRVRHNREIQISSAVSIGTLPSRFHTLLLLIYLGCNLAYCLVLDWQHKQSASVVAELRGRSGQLATLNLVPTILFALRNNPLIPLLRVPYDTFNLFHRWCARVVLVQSIIHTVAFAVNAVNAGGSEAFMTALRTSVSYKWGMVATVALLIIVILSFSPLRHAFYEIFLTLHRVLVLLALIGVYIHIEKAKLPQLPYVRAVFALWGAEWVTRLYRIIHNNLSLRSGTTRVTVEALPAEACRVTFELARPWTFVPGAHVHVYLPTISGLTSHPFSIAWSETTVRHPSNEADLERLPSYCVVTPAAQTPFSEKTSYFPTVTTGAVAEPGTIKPDLAPRPVNERATTTVSVVMRARTGMTRALYERAAVSPTGTLTLAGGIEGPYGGHEPMHSYGTVLLFAGGVGITHCLSHLKMLLTQYGEGVCSTRRILLVWSVPNTEALEWVRPWMDQILRMEGRKDVLRIQLFVTKPRHTGEIRSNTGTVQMFPGRCNPKTIIEKEMVDRVGAMGVMVCGPGAFADTVRAATRERVEEGSVDFIEEAFTY